MESCDDGLINLYSLTMLRLFHITLAFRFRERKGEKRPIIEGTEEHVLFSRF